MIIPLIITVVFGVSVLSLWIYALLDWNKNTVFAGWSRIAWLVIIILGPVGGAVAYFSAKRHVLKFSEPDPARLGRLLSKGP
ncbi:MAG: hypothetical protein RLZZ15_4426 [Verrucomicrobiota bacterium]